MRSTARQLLTLTLVWLAVPNGVSIEAETVCGQFPQSLDFRDFNSADGRLYRDATAGEVGHSVSAADFDGDGRAEIFSAGLDFFGLERTLFSWSSTSNWNGFGRFPNGTIFGAGNQVSTAGDFDRDGFEEVVVSTFTGKSYLIFGNVLDRGESQTVDVEELDGTNGFEIVCGGQTGIVAGGGDLDGDGFSDLAVTVEEDGVGRVRVLLGFSSSIGKFGSRYELDQLDEKQTFDFVGEEANSEFGSSVALIEDLNGDGLSELLVGAPEADGGAGRAYVLYGRADDFPAIVNASDLDGADGFVMEGGVFGDRVGSAVSELGDLNGDGRQDLVLGASGGQGQSKLEPAGEGYVVFGPQGGFPASFDLSSLDGTNGFRFRGIESNEGTGLALAGPGDLNGDGLDDLIIGSWNANAGRGRILGVWGTEAPFPAELDLLRDGSLGFVLDPDLLEFGNRYNLSEVGRSLAASRDSNGDGLVDLVFGTMDDYGVIGGRAEEVLLADGFEDGIDPSWSVRGEVTLVSPGLDGSDDFRIEVPLDLTAEEHALKFKFDRELDNFRIRFLVDGSQNRAGAEVFLSPSRFLKARQSGGDADQLKLLFWEDDSEVSDGELETTRPTFDGPQELIIGWEASSVPGEADGFLQLINLSDRIVGAIAIESRGLRLSADRAKNVQIGLPSGSEGLSGEPDVIQFDEICVTTRPQSPPEVAPKKGSTLFSKGSTLF